MRVLIVDDSAVARALLATHLHHLGCDVLEATDGKEALNFLLEGAIVDGVFLDWHMPRMNGLEFISTIRHLGFTSLQVAMVTAEHDIVRGLSVGANRYITKPYTANQIRNVLVQFGLCGFVAS